MRYCARRSSSDDREWMVSDTALLRRDLDLDEADGHLYGSSLFPGGDISRSGPAPCGAIDLQAHPCQSPSRDALDGVCDLDAGVQRSHDAGHLSTAANARFSPAE